MRNFSLPFVLVSLFLAACAQQPSPQGNALSAAAGADTSAAGLQPRKSGLDQVSAVFAFDLSGASVYVAPVQIDYTKRFSAPATLRARDYELDQKDRQKLDEVMAQTFSEKFLAPRGSQLAASPANADYTMKLSLENFSLAAPLEPSGWLWRVYTEQSAYGVLVGTLYDRNGNAVMRFRDRRDFGDTFGTLSGPGRFERFTSVTFWADMRVDLRRAFSSLDRSLR
ncbi:hypothetical protein [Microbulbifer taiwanensis]|uniref:DUF3313 domain-containing protein n=1 Tax=Microbulbifer taiwanensis TaxID=986746 RepID=A0ABW1YL62_9GAMM|nr:hypothetical protein [Microbulbifer taiwanensis]